jgi:hypothetical protein
MNHHYCAVKYYPGIEDGYQEFKVANHLKKHKIKVLPFIYDEKGEKQFIFENDTVILSDGIKFIKHKLDMF